MHNPPACPARLSDAEARWGSASPRARQDLLERARACLSYALQPIVNIHTGSVFGYEALLRGVEALGLADIPSLFAQAWDQGLSADLDVLLRELAIGRFVALPQARRYRLFFNLDPRMSELEQPAHTLKLLARVGLEPGNLCLELSERGDLTSNPEVARVITAYRQQGFQLAIDDFGSGYAGLQLLYEHPPDVLKIDRYFIAGIAQDHRKRLVVASAVQLAHLMGVQVVAEGVETEAELAACREIGCDLVQGYLIARPQLDLDVLCTTYDRVVEIHRRHTRERTGDQRLIERFAEPIPPIRVNERITRLFEILRHDKGHHVVPVLDTTEQPLGLIHESDIRDFIYSTYGRDLIVNRAFARTVRDLLRFCPTADVHDPIDRLLEGYSASSNPAGIILTRDGRYHGFIAANALLRLVEQKKLAVARDQNPLSKLPGNNPIHEYVSQALSRQDGGWHLVYMDFDNFKAFNDHYGFRRGDRAILLFTELMQDCLRAGWFVGHIGGDDFFAGIQSADVDRVLEQVQRLLTRFGRDVQSLYDPEDRRCGHLLATDRYGQIREMPLMRCSAAVLALPPGHAYAGGDEFGRAIAALKCEAKRSASGLVLRQDARGPVNVMAQVAPDAVTLCT